MIDNNYDAQSDPSQPEEGVGRVESLPKWPFPCCPLFFFFFFFCANLRRFGRISVGLFFKERKTDGCAAMSGWESLGGIYLINQSRVSIVECE